MTFSLALVGRPNVGKSTLFNRLVGKKLALVDDQPGVTRDRREGEARLADLRFTVVDTAGLEEATPESLTGRMQQQTEAALKGADCILFLVDARLGLTPADHFFADLVRRTGKAVLLGANKAEGKAASPGILEAFALGLGEPIALSGEHGDGMAELYDALRPLVDESEEIEAAALAASQDEFFEEDDEDQDTGGTQKDNDQTSPPLMRIAIVGRPNAGKSTLINEMIGSQRLLTGPEAGLTRDSIGIDWEWRGRKFKIFDTAGLRKKSRVEGKLEKLAVSDALRALQFAEVVVVLLDSTIPFEKQDLSIIDLSEREGRAIVIGLNKWDLIENRGATLSNLKEEAARLFQVKGCPIIPVSGLAGTGVDRLMEGVCAAHRAWNHRVSTPKLNRWLAEILAKHPPPAVSGRRVKIRYMTQTKNRPPHFTLFGNQLDSLPESYRRYLVNGLREAFDLPGVPIRLSMRTNQNPFDKKR